MKPTGNKYFNSIKKRAIDGGFTLSDFGKKIGYNRAYFSQIINEHVPMPKDFVEKVEKAFNDGSDQ